LLAEAPSAVSDGRPDLYDAQAASWQPYDRGEEPLLEYLAVDAAQPVTVVAESAQNELEIPRRICWLESKP
jgi:hypothetical protein